MISEREEEEARDLFRMPGWGALMDQLEDQAELCNIDACNTIEELHFNKGRLAVIRMLLSYEDYIIRAGEEEQEYDLLQ